MLQFQVDDAPDFVLEIAAGGDHPNHRRHEPLRRALERRLGELLLVAEVVVQQRLVDAGLGGNLLHAGAGRAAPDEHRVRRIEDALLGVAVLLVLDLL